MTMHLEEGALKESQQSTKSASWKSVGWERECLLGGLGGGGGGGVCGGGDGGGGSRGGGSSGEVCGSTSDDNEGLVDTIVSGLHLDVLVAVHEASMMVERWHGAMPYALAHSSAGVSVSMHAHPCLPASERGDVCIYTLYH
jgi:hypothetical protein